MTVVLHKIFFDQKCSEYILEEDAKTVWNQAFGKENKIMLGVLIFLSKNKTENFFLNMDMFLHMKMKC